MTLINRAHLDTRRSIFPPELLGSATLYRIDGMDRIVDTRQVSFTETRRKPTRSESPSADAPSPTKSKEINFWVNQLDGWQFIEHDLVNIGDEWWAVQSISLDMLDTRWKCQCNPSSDPRGRHPCERDSY